MNPPSAPVVERERERVTNSGSFLRRHKILFGVIILIGILLYATFNLRIYERAKSGKALSPQALLQTLTAKRAGFDVFKGDSLPEQGVTLRNSPAPTPTPTPRPGGPGEFACDPYGICNKYSEEARKQYCTVTYADDRCLDQCREKEKQCTK